MIEPQTPHFFPFLVRLAPEAVEPFAGLTWPERLWMHQHLDRSGERRMAWKDSESVESPHDVWVLYQWNAAQETMEILRVGYFPMHAPPRLELLAAPELVDDEDRWNNEGGR
jgi:hypothetical protein